jgi:hypothetical protein
MTRTSIIALLTALWTVIAPSYAQEAPAETPASGEVSVSGEVASQSSGEVTGFEFDIDAGLGLNLSAEQTIEFRAIVGEESMPPVEVDFDVAIGSGIPASVTLSLLPRRIAQLIPGIEGYLFFQLGDGRIIVVSPVTLKVVLIVYG